MIQKLQRRVSFRAPDTPNLQSFNNMQSKDLMSIYRVSEASNESPDKISRTNRNSINSRRRDKSHSGRISASFYFHANKLSAWQSDASKAEDGGEYVDELSELIVPVPMAQKKTLSLTLHLPGKHVNLLGKSKSSEAPPQYKSKEVLLANKKSKFHSANQKSQSKKEIFIEPVTTLKDEEVTYPFFSNPTHIRSIRSQHDYSSNTSPASSSKPPLFDSR